MYDLIIRNGRIIDGTQWVLLNGVPVLAEGKATG